MNAKLQALLARQQTLIAQSAEQREAIATSLDSWKKPISWLDRGWDALQLIQKNRIVLYGAFALLATYKPAGARKILLASMSILNVAHHARDWMRSQKFKS